MERVEKQGLNMVERIKNYFAETRIELRKVTWPNKNELKDATKVVLVASFILSVFVGIIDQILSNIIKIVFR